MEASASVIVPGQRLGKLAPRYDPRTLRLARYLKPAAVLKAPLSLDLTKPFTGTWGMLGNDNFGDCTCAALGHMDQTWAAQSGQPQDMTDDAIFGRPGGLYWRTGTEDNGRDMLGVLNEVVANGLAGDKFVAFAALEPMNYPPRRDLGEAGLIRYAASAFGGVYLGFALPVSAQSQTIWDYVPHANGNEPGSWGGHAVNLVGYTRKGYTIVTWGGLKQVTWRFHYRYCDEAYAIISPDWLNALGKSPTGFDMAKLQADLAAIKK